MNNQLQAVLAEALHPTVEDPLRYYVLACSLSQTEQPTIRSLGLLLTLCGKDTRGRWLEIVRRISKQHLQFMFDVYRNELSVYSGLVQQLFEQRWQLAITHIVSVMLQHMAKAVAEPTSPQILQVLYRTLADILRAAESLHEITDVFLRNSNLVCFLQRCSLPHSQYYLETVRLLINRYVQLEKVNIASLTIFEFSKFFEPFTEFMRILLVDLLTKPPTEETLQVIIMVCSLPSMYMAVTKLLPGIVGAAVGVLELYSTRIPVTEQEHFSEIIHYEDDILGARVSIPLTKKSETTATLATQLLVRLCRNVDGVLSKLLRITLAAIVAIFNKEHDTEVTHLLYRLSPGQDVASRLSLYYLLLCVIRKPLSEREDLREKIFEFAEYHSRSLLAVNDSYPLVSFRVVKFVECYCTLLKQTQFEAAVNLLLRCIRMSSGSLYGEQACESLQVILRQEHLYRSIEHCIYDALSHIVSILDITRNCKFVELLTFLVNNFKTPTERYSVMLLNGLSRRITAETQQCALHSNWSSQLLLCLFDCFTAVIGKGDVLEQNYMNLEGVLKGLPELLNGSHRITFENKILQVAGVIVEKSGEFNDYVVGCLRYLRTVYEKTYTLVDLHSFISRCYAFAHKFILWEAQQVVRLFADVLLDNLNRTFGQERRGFVDCCYLIMAHLQYLDQYYKETEDELLEFRNGVLRLLQRCSSSHRQPLELVLISLFYVQPFELSEDSIVCKLTTDDEVNKMYVLYLGFSLQYIYTDARMERALLFLNKYIASKLVLPPKQKSNPDKMEREESDLEEEDSNPKLLQLDYLDAKSLKLPLLQLNELEAFKLLVKRLEKSQKINHDNMSEEARRIMKQLPNIIVCGKRMRELHCFDRTEQEH